MESRITLLTLGVTNLSRSVRFYRDGLGFPTTYKEGDGVAFFNTGGTRLALYPLTNLASDISPEIQPVTSSFPRITLAHNVRGKEEVAQVLALAEQAGARIIRKAHDVFWGGHVGYFTDPDGFYWEIAWNPHMPLDPNGFLTLNP